MGIIGENLDQDLINQIDIRQSKLGKPVLDHNDIIYNNSNTSWLRVASSVDVEDTQLAGLDDFSAVGGGNRFAKNAVLFGPAGRDEDPLGRFGAFGFAEGSSLDSSTYYNYGWGGNINKWGYTPPPAVENMSITALNRGAIRKANISLVAHNPDQFRLIEALYLRLGFTILVEWGHTIYYNNQGNLQQRSDFSTLPFSTFMEGGDSNVFSTVTKQLIEERNLSNYNYDGFIGYISNFNWTFGADGTYKATLNVITRGGLIDSLKTNHVVNSKSVPKDESGNETSKATILVAYLENWKQTLKSDNDDAGLSRIGPFSFSPSSIYDRDPSEDEEGNIFPGLSVESVYGLKLLLDGELLRYEMSTSSTKSGFTSQYYISLGCFLRFIKEQGLFYNDNGDPIIDIETDYETTFMLRHPFQNSVDPKICMLTSASPKIGDIIGADSFPIKLVGDPLNFFETDNPFKGDMMGIMVNMDYIVSQVNSTKTDDGVVPLGPLLQNILTGVSRVTGNINSFNVSYDEDTNTLNIKDDTSIPGVTPKRNSVGKFHVYGITNGELKNSTDLLANLGKGLGSSTGVGSFVENLSFTSKIFPSLQNAVAIAAQNPETTAGEQVSSYQRLNKGLRDRVSKGAKPFNKTNEQTPFEFYIEEIIKVKEHFAQCYNGYRLPEESVIEDFTTALKDILSYDIQYRATKGQITSPFFIPVELSLTIKGLSGFKLYEKFDIGPDYILPQSYPNNVNFIIQGVTHDLRDNKWTTTLNTLSWPSEQSVELQDFSDIIKGQELSPPTRKNNNPSSEVTTIASNPSLPTEIWWGDAYTTRDSFGIKPFARTSPNEVVKYINTQFKPYALDFLNGLLVEPRMQGLKVSINSTIRTIPQQEEVTKTAPKVAAKPGTSPHQFGMAFDITLFDLGTGKQLRNNTNSPQEWVETGIVDVASAAKLSSWGATFNRYDPLHFGIKFSKTQGKAEYARIAKEQGKRQRDVTAFEIKDMKFAFYPGPGPDASTYPST